MTNDSQETHHLPVGKATLDLLRNGDLTWKAYINALTPEDYEMQRQYDRDRVKKWYQDNRERLTEKHQCNTCGGRYTIKMKKNMSRRKNIRKPYKHQTSRRQSRHKPEHNN